MSDEVDLPPGMFTPAGTPQLPAAMMTATPFTSALYPTQMGGPPVIGRAGELRGFYAANRWKPKWSRFKYPRTPGTLHGGVDIFAPRGTPIVAMVAGDVEHRADGDPMGTRVHLRFTYSGVAYRFILGHLDHFDGAERSVVQGTVVGYAGCTGNAGGAQPCLTANACGKYSTHLHLQLKRDTDGLLLDPLQALGWRLAYDDDERDTLCQNL